MKTKTKAILCISISLVFLFSAASSPAIGASPSGGLLNLQSMPMVPVSGQSNSTAGPSYTKSESFNWAGYAVSGVGVIKEAQGSWVQTKATCNQTADGDQYTAFWVGIDGFASSTVEQTGTLVECAKGSSTPHYIAWYEFYPAQAIIVIPGFKVHVGDLFSATVLGSKNASSFTVILNDTTTGQTYTTNSPSGFSGERSSAECITEEPAGSSGFFLLAKYAKDPWGIDNTKLIGCTANGKSFGSYGVNAYEITDVNENNFKVMDQPTSLSADGTSFVMIWKSEGP